ncbi:MAG: site-2 protease family protein [Fimbriimonadaceae bacterium]
MFEGLTLNYAIATAIIIFFAIGLHEYAHAKVADMAGDPTPRSQGRVTLNLTKHFELFGTIMIIFSSLSGFGIGWGKPVQVNPLRMKNHRWDHFASVIAGPLSNFIQAMLFAIIFRIIALASPALLHYEFLQTLLTQGVIINIALMLFNLIPFGPLDGHWLVGLMMPEPQRTKWFIFNRTTGSLVLLGIILAGQFTGFSIIGLIIETPAIAIFKFLLGV